MGRGDASVDPDMGEEGGDERFVGLGVEFGEGGPGETDVVFVEEGLVEGGAYCVGYSCFFVDGLPAEFCC